MRLSTSKLGTLSEREGGRAGPGGDHSQPRTGGGVSELEGEKWDRFRDLGWDPRPLCTSARLSVKQGNGTAVMAAWQQEQGLIDRPRLLNTHELGCVFLQMQEFVYKF